MQRTPSKPAGGEYVLFEHFWVKAGPLPLPESDARLGDGKFVLTNSVSMHLRNLARAVLCRYPILLQVLQESSMLSRNVCECIQLQYEFMRLTAF